MLEQSRLNSLKKGDSVDHILIVKKSEERPTKTGKTYLRLELGDGVTSLVANFWDNLPNYAKLKSELKENVIVSCKGRIDEYQNNYNIGVSEISIVEDESILAYFIPHSEKEPDQLRTKLLERISKIKNPFLFELVNNIFSEERLDKFCKSPAGKHWHHSYIHGLVEHTIEIMSICDLMCDFHAEINRDLVISGALLHDFGKIEEISPELGFAYTDKGKLLGHIVISTMMIEEETKKIDNFPEDLKICLQHLVLSHQGKLEFASPVVPKTLEAITLYQADELSAKVNAYKYALKNEIKPESKWTKNIYLISSDLYDHGIKEFKEEDLNNNQEGLFSNLP